jgi:chromosomal replication initiation ATPase DnaA
MTLTLDEITYLYELALNDNPPNMIFSNEKNKSLKNKLEIEIDHLNSLKSDPKEKLIFMFIERELGINKKKLLDANRKQDLCDIRRAVCVILHEDYSYSKCGEIMMRDHSTITHQCMKHKELYGRDKKYTDIFDFIGSYMKSSGIRSENLSHNTKLHTS